MSISRLYFRGRSTGDFEGVTVASCDYGDLESKRADVDIAGADGTLTTHANGRHYRAREITIVFNVLATPATVEARLTALRGWLSEDTGELSDDYNTGWVWTNAEFKSAHTDYLDMFRGSAQLTVKMTAGPMAQRAGAVNNRLAGFAVRGDCSITIGSWVREGVTMYHIMVNDADYHNILTVDTVMDAPFVFRLEAISENAAAASILGEGDIEIGVPFAHEPSFYMQITHSGYGWYELWHDTREVVP